MKKINIIYWISTGIIVAMMLSSGIMSVMNTANSVKLTAHLGYPPYFNSYLGAAKILGCIALIIPGFARIKEWAYAGFTFDMISAIYSFIAIGDKLTDSAPILIFIAILFVSYIYHHKRLQAAGVKDAVS